MASLTEKDRTPHEAERQARQVQQTQQAASNQEAWDHYVDSRIALYLSRHTEVSEQSHDLLPDALHQALGQVIAEERRQWRRERELIESEAQKTIAELRATIAELKNEIREKALEAKPGVDAVALDQAITDFRQQWERERKLIESEASKTISDLRATIAELENEIRQKALDAKPGAPGVAGPPGERGPEGRPGKLPIAKTFEPGRVYYEGDVATRDGSTYQALRDTGHGVSHADWICLARAGRDGRDGATPEVRGTYDAHANYKKLDIVASDGAAFVARRDNPGIIGLGDGWQLMSRQGRPGRKGETGERGPRGEKGDQGPPAEVPQFLGSRIDENYNLLRILSDGTKEILALRPAFEQFHRETGE